MFLFLTVMAMLCAAVPMLLFIRNLRLYHAPPAAREVEGVSVLVPARNEENSIAACVNAALQSERVELEVIVLDDHSEDRTAVIVQEIACKDRRVSLVKAPALPPDWCGKQFACSILAGFASRPVLCFLDADVQLQRDGLARMITALRESDAFLISGFPRQVTVTPMEQLLLPLMHFILLGFLPLDRMRRSKDPRLGAGCGQIFVADREAYQRAGGHEAIRGSRHDGLTLPRAFRRAGFTTDLCDATSVAACRMYRNSREVFAGLSKNATEGLGAPERIVPFSIILLAGQVLPPALLVYGFVNSLQASTLVVATLATLAAYFPRIVAVFRFKQPLAAALFHPAAIVILLGIQWLALLRAMLRLPAQWKGRSYSATP